MKVVREECDGGAAAPPLAGSRERAQADLAALRRQVRELRRRSALAAAADHRLAGVEPGLPGLLATEEL